MSTADLAGVWVGLPAQVRAVLVAAEAGIAHVRHERSVDRWTAELGVRLGVGQRDRMVKFFDDWTRQ